MSKDRYISIDIETTGLDPERCQVLEIGAIIEDWESPVAELPTFQCYVKHDEYHGEPFALAMNKRIFDILAGIVKPPPTPISNPKYGATHRMYAICPAHTVGSQFAEWLLSNRFSFQNQIVVAGKNFGSFDMQFLKRLLNFGKIASRFHYRFIDPSMLYWNPEDEIAPPSMRKCLTMAGISTEEARHHAVDDAQLVIRLIRHHFEVLEKWDKR